MLLTVALLAAPSVAQAQRASASVCLPEALDPALDAALRAALELELERALVGCDEDASVRVRLASVSPVAPFTVDVELDGRATSSRTEQPADVMGARAIAVVARSLLDELELPPEPPVEPSPRAASTPEAREVIAPEPPDQTAAPAVNLPVYIGVTASAALMIGWGDATVADLERESRMNALTVGGALRLHSVGGHGGAVSVRFFPSEIVSAFQVDLRYSFRVGHPPAVDGVGVAAFFETGLAVVRGWYSYTDPDGANGGAIERVGVGPSVAVSGFVYLGPVAIGLEVGYVASVNPWGSRDLLSVETGHADEITFGSDVEVALRLGVHLPI